MADIARLLGDGRVVGSKKEGQSAMWSNFALLFFKESGEYTDTLDMSYVCLPLEKIC